MVPLGFGWIVSSSFSKLVKAELLDLVCVE